MAETPHLTTSDVLAAHADYGPLDWDLVKKAMGPNWPAQWEAMGPGQGIFDLSPADKVLRINLAAGIMVRSSGGLDG